MDCPGVTNEMILSLSKNNVNFNVERNRLKKKLRKIDIFFKNQRNFTTQNILFTHIWQRQLYQNGNGNKKETQKKLLDTRVQILKAVVHFVIPWSTIQNGFGIIR